MNGVYYGANGITATVTFNGTIGFDEKVTTYIVDAKRDEKPNLDSRTGTQESVIVKPEKQDGPELYGLSCVVRITNTKTNEERVATGTDEVLVAVCGTGACTITKEPTSTTLSMNFSVTNLTGGDLYIKTSKTGSFKSKLSSVDGKYKFSLKRSNNQEGISVYAITNSGCCKYDEIGAADKNCIKWNADGTKSVKDVKDYCTENLESEVHQYSSVSQCVEQCSACGVLATACDTENRQKVEIYCNEKYATNETLAAQCLNRCYAQKVCSREDYVFRPINNYNPFPNSYDSEAPYETGKRIVGANWVGFTQYIKNDQRDASSITGPSNNVEYVIDLTPEDIRMIRSDTENKKNNNKIDAYTELIYSTELDKSYRGEYISSFIHDNNKSEGGFASLFSDPSSYKK